MKMTQELSSFGIDDLPEKLLGEIKYLSEEVRRFEIENFELRQELQFMELLIQDIQIGPAKGEVN